MREKVVIVGLMVCSVLCGYSIAEQRAVAAKRTTVPPAGIIFDAASCKLKLCLCDGESKGYDEEAHAAAATAAAMIDARTAAAKPLDASEEKLIVDTFTANAARSRANRDAAKRVAEILAAPLLP